MVLSAAIPASDIATTGTAQVTVFNPGSAGGTSNSATFTIAAASAGVLGRVSLTTGGGQANDQSLEPTMSANGRYVAFSSIATNVVAGDTNGFPDVFLRDTCTNVPTGCTPTTIRVSVTNSGSQAGDSSDSPAISADGRFVALRSFATNLVGNDTNGFVPDIYLRDTCIGATGCVPSTTRISVSTAGVQANEASGFPSISANGRYVAFESTDSTLVPNDVNGSYDVFVRDTCFNAPAGCTPSTTRVSLTSTGGEAQFGGLSASISADGRFVAFISDSPDIVTPNVGNSFFNIYVRDTCTGAPAGCVPTTVRASVSSSGGDSDGESSGVAIISANGRYVAFDSVATNLVPNDTNNIRDVFLRDTCLGAPAGCVPTTMRVSVSSAGAQADGISSSPSVNADGRFVAFSSLATNLVAGDTNAVRDVFVRDTCLGATVPCTPSTMRVSVTTSGTQANDQSSRPSLSADGRLVAFVSLATNLITDDTNTLVDVFLARTGF